MLACKLCEIINIDHFIFLSLSHKKNVTKLLESVLIFMGILFIAQIYFRERTVKRFLGIKFRQFCLSSAKMLKILSLK